MTRVSSGRYGLGRPVAVLDQDRLGIRLRTRAALDRGDRCRGSRELLRDHLSSATTGPVVSKVRPKSSPSRERDHGHSDAELGHEPVDPDVVRRARECE